MNGRYVLIALARSRVPWLERIVQITNSGALPAEIRKAVGVVDLIGQIGTGRPASAVVLDAGAPGVDRDLIFRIQTFDTSVFVVVDPSVPHDWRTLGADATLSPDFDAHDLLDALIRSSTTVANVGQLTAEPDRDRTDEPAPWDAPLIAVLGAGGTGTSTIAMATAQGLADGSGHSANQTALLDLCLSGEQVMLHDADPSSAGLLELVDRCRLGMPSPESVREHLIPVHKRGYDLLPGLRRRRLWTQLRTSSTATTLTAVRRSYELVVADLDPDLEGEQESGSVDIEDRNQLTRLAVAQATVTLIVGHASMKGLHSMTRIIRDVVEYGNDPSTIQPVFNHAPTSARAKAGYTAALAELTDGLGLSSSSIFVPTKDIDDRLRALVPFPASVVDPLAGALSARLSQRPAVGRHSETVGGRVRPGFLRRGAATS